MRLTANFDGSCGPTASGTAAYGYIIHDEEWNVVKTAYGRVGRGKLMSSNLAEYSGLCAAMEWIIANHPEARVEFRGDSTLVINQMNGMAKAKKGRYLPSYQRAIALAQPYIEKGLWSFEWIPREMNQDADNLAQYMRC